MDPLAEKYYSISPYAYVLNNPLKYIDPDGRKVYFAPGQSQEFKTQFGAAVQHLNKHGAGGMLAQLHSSEKVYYVAEGNFTSVFYLDTQTIVWDPYMGILTDEGHVMSPTAALSHEVDHALQYDTKKGQMMKDLAEIKGDPYNNAEERRVIEGSEQTTAKKLGEIKEGEVTRKNHGGIKYRTVGPTSTKGVYELEEIVVTPNENEKNNIIENTWDSMYPWNTDFMRK